MRTVGIIGAMEEEIISIKEKMTIISVKNTVGVDFYMGHMNGKNIVLARSGIGKVNAAVCTQAMISLFAVDYIINVGVAGGLAKDLHIGDIVLSTDLVQHDMDTSAFGDPIGTIPRMPESFFPADAALLQIAVQAGESIDATIVTGRIASGDRFVSDSADKQRIYSLFKPQCVEMEGAAIAHACYLNKIPFIVIRAISDSADDTANISFDKFAAQAAKNSSALVEQMIQLL